MWYQSDQNKDINKQKHKARAEMTIDKFENTFNKIKLV